MTSSIVDTEGAHAVTIIVIASTSNSTSNPFATLQVLTNTTNSTTGMAADTIQYGTAAILLNGVYYNGPLVGGTATSTSIGFVIPNGVTSTGSLPYMVINADWRNRNRYFEVQLSPVTTQTATVIVLLSRKDTAPSTLTDFNVSGMAVA